MKITRFDFILSLLAPLIAPLLPSKHLCTWCGSLLKCQAGPRSCPDSVSKYTFQVKNPKWEWCTNEKCGWWDIMPTRQEYEAEKNFKSSGDWRPPRSHA